MRINLRRRNIGMAEQLLDDAQIRAVLQQVAGKGVAQNVRADAPPGKTGRRRGRFEVACKSLAREVSAFAVGREEPGRARGVRTRLLEHAAVEPHRLARFWSERYEPLTPALAAHRDKRLARARGALRQSDKLGHAQTRRVEDFEQAKGACGAQPLVQGSRFILEALAADFE